ncbi:MAG: DUF479 domain-containing protein [Ichthyobacteriaceae bacterium]|nr:DUF479 domain-containing protein [Ichthyobacteriaceae bacterium]
MNFLAHSYLSFNNPGILIGNFIGDFVKGKAMHNFSSEIKEGIILHRKIDEFTDKHPVFKKSVYRINPKYNKYRFVINDMFFDHILAVKWSKYHDTDLLDYTNNVYSILEDNINILPANFQYAFKFMKEGNWLYNYKNLDDLTRYLKGISNRSKYADNLEYSVEDLEEYYNDFSNDFDEFFPEIIEFSKEHIKLNL